MCGISGYVTDTEARRPHPSILDEMTDCLAHRGPDDRGVYAHPLGGLGFRRLSILDLSPAGHQPMVNENGTVWVTVNGEIFNYRELRQSLLQRGHVFRSQSDSEVVVHGFEEWGEALLDRLEGMFALAIWDQPAQTLLLARDRFGIKPLHYAEIPGGVAYGSEIKALLRHPAVSRELDHQAIWSFLAFAQIPAPETIYRQVRKLPPGHLIHWTPGSLRIRRYYQLPPPSIIAGPDEQLAEELEIRLRQAVKSHLVSDVPIGFFLSGGLDSSLLTALAASISGTIETFSVQFPDAFRHDESRYQRLVARHLGTHHHELSASANLVKDLPDVLAATDEPFAISSFVPLLHMARLAARDVKVVMSGDGSDEIFAGYGSRYLNPQRWASLGRLLASHVRPPADDAIWHNQGRWSRLRRRALLSSRSEQELYLSLYNWFSRWEAAALFQPAALAGIRQEYDAHVRSAYDLTLPDSLERKLRCEIQTSLPDEMLTKLDRATSSVSLEGRVPFLDRSVVEFALSIPAGRRYDPALGKALLRRVAARYLPREIVERPKTGFVVPLSDWLRRDETFLQPFLLEPAADFDAIVRPQAVKAMIEAHRSHRGEHGERLWALYVLKRWFASAPARGHGPGQPVSQDSPPQLNRAT